MAIGNDLRLPDMLNIFIRVCMARLELSSAHVFLFQTPDGTIAYSARQNPSPSLQHYLSIPRQFQGESWQHSSLLQHLVSMHVQSGKRYSYGQHSKHYHCFTVPDYGVIIFESVQPLQTIILKALEPIFNKLALSCYACIAHESLKQEIAARHLAEQTIAYQASHDELTRLANRRVLSEQLYNAVEQSKRENTYGALLFIDLNQFKSINDVMGHDFGDTILQDVAQRLLTIARPQDTVARFGGDEFVVLLPDLGSCTTETTQRIAEITEQINRIIELPFELAGAGYNISCSIGYDIFPRNNASISDILKNADLAMYEAKAVRQRGALAYKPQMSEKHNQRLAYVSDLKQALRNKEFALFYQPQCDYDGNITGAEALLRWLNPKYQHVSPAVYIPIAEDSELILEIGQWVLEEACRHLAALQQHQLLQGFKKLSINVSGKQLVKKDFFEDVCSALSDSKAPADYLCIEITENILVDGIKQAMTLMTKLRALGIECSIDDFGTGYSSLSYLKRFPASTIKIDRAFVSNIQNDAENLSIAQMIINLSSNLGMNTLAEGVENQEELCCLQQLGCQQYQGYYFSRPVPFDQLLTMLQHNITLPLQTNSTQYRGTV